MQKKKVTVLNFTEKCNPQQSSKKTLCNRHKPLQNSTIKMQNCGAQSQRIHLQNTPVPKTQETFQKKGQKELKSQRIWEFAVRLCLIIMSETIPVNAHKCDCSNIIRIRITSMDINAKVDRKYLNDHNPVQSTIGN